MTSLGLGPCQENHNALTSQVKSALSTRSSQRLLSCGCRCLEHRAARPGHGTLLFPHCTDKKADMERGSHLPKATRWDTCPVWLQSPRSMVCSWTRWSSALQGRPEARTGGIWSDPSPRARPGVETKAERVHCIWSLGAISCC